jgi:DNA mismatch repair protein MutS
MSTPLMRQYQRIKKEHPDAVLFFRLGDFYEMFYDDAQLASRLLGITLTARVKESERVPMAGFPHHAAGGYIRRFLQAGHRVAICEQVEAAAAAQGLVDRRVIRVITPGTVVDEEGLLEARRPNPLVALAASDGKLGYAWVDLSTGHFELEELPLAHWRDFLGRVEPSECLYPEGAREAAWFKEVESELQAVLRPHPDWTFDPENARRVLLEHFRTVSLEGFGCEDLTQAASCAGAILHYLGQTHQGGLGHLRALRRFQSGRCVVVDRPALRVLEVLSGLRPGAGGGTGNGSNGKGDGQGSLLGVLDKTRTALGGRMLRSWLAAPLRDLEAIRLRQDAVEDLFKDAERRRGLQTELEAVHDLERLAGRIESGRCNGRDLRSLASSLAHVPEIQRRLASASAGVLLRLRDSMHPLEELRGDIERTLVDDPSPVLQEGGLIRPGVDQELDRLRRIEGAGHGWIERFQAAEVARTGIPSLKVGYNRVFGYYIEVTHTHRSKVPADYVRKQTMKNAERYSTPQLKEQETRVLEAASRAHRLELELFEALRVRVAARMTEILGTAASVAELDAVVSLAEAAEAHGYVRPEVVEEPVLEIHGGRHPVLECVLSDGFVPNDLQMGPGRNAFLITGPNMAGKSTYIRQVALIVLMAHAGSFVPAASARVGWVDRIFTRIGADDELQRGRSTFLVEMEETAQVLHHATDRSLVILDEVGRGTSTYDGMSLAWAVVEDLARRVRARTLFATHYHELTEMEKQVGGVCNFNVLVKEWRGKVVFLHKIVPGAAGRSYGIHVARLAGVPDAVVGRAEEVLRSWEGGRRVRKAGMKAAAAAVQGGDLFVSAEDPLRGRLRDLKPDGLTPLQALQLLTEWHAEASKS